MILVGFVSRDGVLIASQADTSAAALNDLVQHFGEEVVDAFELARVEIAQAVAEMVGEAGAADPRTLAAGSTPPLGGEADSHDAGGTPAADPAADSPPAPEAADADEGATAGSGDDGPPVPPVDGGGVAGGARCVIGDEVVAEGLAEVSVMRFGDVRCKAHGSW